MLTLFEGLGRDISFEAQRSALLKRVLAAGDGEPVCPRPVWRAREPGGR